MNNEATVSDQTVLTVHTCVKCDGTGRINFSNVANGRCFDCGGSGKLRAMPHNALRALVGHLSGTANTALHAARHGHTERRDFYLGLMVADMFRIGTVAARELLTEMSTGRYHDDDDHTGYRTAQCPVPHAVQHVGETMPRSRGTNP